MAAKPQYDYSDKLSFFTEWTEHETGHHKNFLLNFYPCDETVELFDRDLNRIFLRRCICEGVRMKDIFVGNTIRVYNRQLNITEYADCKTKNFVGKSKEHTFVLIKPSAMNKLGEVLSEIERNNFQIARMRWSQLTRKEALDFYEAKKGNAFLPFIIEHVVSGPIVALELVGENAIERWLKLMGPENPIEARSSDPDSFRALYGKEMDSNGFDGATDQEAAVRAACFFFPQGIEKKPPPTTCTFKNSTCCILKPHAIEEGKLGPIITHVMGSKFKITALRMFYLTNANADEFLEVYKGVVSDFHAFLLSFLDGPCVALEISGKEENMDVHDEFRKFTGPFDSDVARQIRPNTLRGMFGVDKYKNAVHCTDLPEDVNLELEYFFQILDN